MNSEDVEAFFSDSVLSHVSHTDVVEGSVISPLFVYMVYLLVVSVVFLVVSVLEARRSGRPSPGVLVVVMVFLTTLSGTSVAKADASHKFLTDFISAAHCVEVVDVAKEPTSTPAWVCATAQMTSSYQWVYGSPSNLQTTPIASDGSVDVSGISSRNLPQNPSAMILTLRGVDSYLDLQVSGTSTKKEL